MWYKIIQNFNILRCLVLEISAFQYEACHGFRAGATVHKLFVGGVWHIIFYKFCLMNMPAFREQKNTNVDVQAPYVARLQKTQCFQKAYVFNFGAFYLRSVERKLYKRFDLWCTTISGQCATLPGSLPLQWIVIPGLLWRADSTWSLRKLKHSIKSSMDLVVDIPLAVKFL